MRKRFLTVDEIRGCCMDTRCATSPDDDVLWTASPTPVCKTGAVQNRGEVGEGSVTLAVHQISSLCGECQQLAGGFIPRCVNNTRRCESLPPQYPLCRFSEASAHNSLKNCKPWCDPKKRHHVMVL